MTGLVQMVGGLFPDGVGAGAVAIGTAPDPLPAEIVAVSRAIDGRQQEFAAGRAAARAAMMAAGLTPAPIPMAEDRAPVWPAGTTGSISHAAEVALAVAASTRVASGLGLDIEPDAPLPHDVLSDICDGDECGWIAGRPQPLRWARLIFAAKEAAFKCQYPASRALFGFDVLQVRVEPGSGGLSARFTKTVAPFAEGHLLTGRFAFTAGLILTGFIREAAR